LWRGFEKYRQQSGLLEERGGYGCIRSPSSGDLGPPYLHIDTRQPSDWTGVAQDLNPLEQRENPGKASGIWSSGFIQVKWLDFVLGRSPRFNLNRPSFGTRVGIFDEVEVQCIGGPEDRILLQLGIANSNSPRKRRARCGTQLMSPRQNEASGI
jgi:hypothetical protein